MGYRAKSREFVPSARMVVRGRSFSRPPWTMPWTFASLPVQTLDRDARDHGRHRPLRPSWRATRRCGPSGPCGPRGGPGPLGFEGPRRRDAFGRHHAEALSYDVALDGHLSPPVGQDPARSWPHSTPPERFLTPASAPRSTRRTLAPPWARRIAAGNGQSGSDHDGVKIIGHGRGPARNTRIKGGEGTRPRLPRGPGQPGSPTRVRRRVRATGDVARACSGLDEPLELERPRNPPPGLVPGPVAPFRGNHNGASTGSLEERLVDVRAPDLEDRDSSNPVRGSRAG